MMAFLFPAGTCDTSVFYINVGFRQLMPPDVPQPAGLLYNPKSYTSQLAPLGALHVTMTPATLAVKGVTVWREMAGKFGLKVAS
jgi:hypothetical protein